MLGEGFYRLRVKTSPVHYVPVFLTGCNVKTKLCEVSIVQRLITLAAGRTAPCLLRMSVQNIGWCSLCWKIQVITVCSFYQHQPSLVLLFWFN